MYTSSNEECDFNANSLVKNIHYLLVIYLFVASFLCVKRSMFLDVTIGISFLAVLYKRNLLIMNIFNIIKVLIGIFGVSTVLDLAWLIVYFPSWNRSLTSEDEGAQEILRIIILGGSLLFMIYKVLLIVAVFFLNKELERNSDVAH